MFNIDDSDSYHKKMGYASGCLLLICLSIFGGLYGIFTYMHNKHCTVVGQNGTRYETYREACNDYDFQAAHDFISLMIKESAPGGEMQNLEDHDINEAMEYVFQHEVLYLLTENREDSNIRVLLLIKEQTSNRLNKDDCCDYVLDAAIMTGNEELANAVIPLYKDKDRQEVAKEKLQEAVESGKFED